jgi:hypothetical protein
MLRVGVLLLLLALAGVALARPEPAAAQQRERCFPETGYCVSGTILDYWERTGGLAVFGYPISPLIPNEIVEDTWVGPTQWFERDRLEDHSAEGLGVLAGRLGVRFLEMRGQSWWDFPRLNGPAPDCAYFPETNHGLCEPFLSYWRSNGGLERFGYPVSEPMQETIGDWSGTVQYFERRRMEHHSEFAGTPYEVLLGRLGADVMQMAPPARCTNEVGVNLRASVAGLPFRDRLGCPTTLDQHIPAATQDFESGKMIWVDLGDGERSIYVISPDLNPAHERRYRRFDDPWQEGDSSPNLGAPEGYYAPVRGFGQIWYEYYRRHPAGLGWAVEPERAENATVQQFTSGATVIWIKGEEMIYAFGDDPHELSTFRRK